MSSKSFHPHLQNEFLVKINWLVLGWFRLAAVTSSLAHASVWRFSEVSGSLLHVVVKYTLHRLFEQNFYRIISELFSSGSVLGHYTKTCHFPLLMFDFQSTVLKIFKPLFG